MQPQRNYKAVTERTTDSLLKAFCEEQMIRTEALTVVQFQCTSIVGEDFQLERRCPLKAGILFCLPQ
jgi:hypothetical protein